MNRGDWSFITDTRAVTTIIGVLLLLSLFMIAFAGYQASTVPQQNAETELQHYQDVQNDLTVIRNTILRAGQQNQNQFESVRLGTNYRERILALNPPAPAGTLRTSEKHMITIDNGMDSTNISTRFLEYRNGYNELNIEPIYYENSVLYLDSESGQRAFFEDQNLIMEDGTTIVVTALQREFSRSATGRITLELYPTDGGDPLPTGELNVTLPTQLPNSYWRGELKGEDPISESSYNYTNRTNKVNQVSFNVSSEDLELNTVGINDAPDKTDAVSNTDGSSESGTDGSSESGTDGSSESGTDGSSESGENGDTAATLELVDDSTPGSESSALEFNISNTGQEAATITEFNLSTPGNQNSAVTDSVDNINRDATSNDYDNAEVQIRDSNELLGFATPDSGENDDFDTGTDSDLMDRSGKDGRGDEATIDSGAVVSVNMGKFNNGNVQLTYNSTDNKKKSDLTATFTLEDGTTVEFYFRVTNVNT